MKIVVDTNVFISGVFFGGFPRMVLDMIIDKKVTGSASKEILEEYDEIVQRMHDKKHKTFNKNVISQLIEKLNVIEVSSDVSLCRDPDDDKFINCAIDSKSIYIVSGDSDLLDLKNIGNIEIVAAKEFCEKYFD